MFEMINHDLCLLSLLFLSVLFLLPMYINLRYIFNPEIANSVLVISHLEATSTPPTSNVYAQIQSQGITKVFECGCRVNNQSNENIPYPNVSRSDMAMLWFMAHNIEATSANDRATLAFREIINGEDR